MLPPISDPNPSKEVLDDRLSNVYISCLRETLICLPMMAVPRFVLHVVVSRFEPAAVYFIIFW